MTADRPTRGQATRERIIDAALATLREQGFSEVTARAIARRGGFNQALIFYHFGTVANLLIEAFRELSEEQVARYQEAAAEVASLSDLVAIARRLHAEDLETGAITAVTQLMAAASEPDEKLAVLDRFERWIELVQTALQRSVQSSAMESLVPTRQAAYAIAGMFLGIELISRLDPERSEAESVFDMLEAMATLIEKVAPILLQQAPDGEPG